MRTLHFERREKSMKKIQKHLLALLIVIAGVTTTGVVLSEPVQPTDWDSIEAKDLILFYPGQASWEWALTQSSHSGAKKFRSGKNCRDCHSGEEADIGALIVSGEKLEPAPIAGKPGSIQLTVKIAHDADNLYVRLAWPLRSSVGQQQDADFETRITMMLGDATVKEAPRAGCWGACHADLSKMPNTYEDGKSLKKYLSRSRTKVTRQGGGRNYKSEDELQELINAGYFMEYWQAGLSSGQAAEVVDGYVLDTRNKFDKPIVSVVAEVVDGRQVVTLSRRLNAGDPLRKDIKPGIVYVVGFALHEASAKGRRHFVSFEHSLVLDEGGADFVVSGF
jgi:cytochrome c-type protein NapC